MNTAHIIGAWRTWLFARDLSPETIRLRVYQVRRFAESHPQLLAVGVDELNAWLGRPGWSTNTRRSQLAALRSFYGWAHATGRIVADPSRLLARIRPAQLRPRPAPARSVRVAMIGAQARTRLMLTLAVRQGLRRGEIALVNTATDLVEDLVGWSLIVHGKGRKERTVPLAGDVAEMLLALPAGWVFPGLTGGHLSAGHVGVLMARALPDGLTAHTLRHAFATNAYRATRDLLAVQELLGHSKPETTRAYIMLPEDALRAAVEAAA
jgi:integrase